MLKLNHIKKIYDKQEILTDVDYTFEEGKIYPILGGTGAGRTTLFECISGDIPLDGGAVVSASKRELFYAAKQSVLPMYISGYEFIEFLCSFRKKRNVDEYLDRVNLREDVRGEMICTYSFEDKKRLQLAAFLVQRPYVVMFDEPLDFCNQNYIDEFLYVLRQECSDHVVLISTSVLDVARQISPDILVLNNGELNEVTAEMIDIPEIHNAILDILGDLEE
jgi:ABC-2 type transport system ATP-binding protein